MTGVEADLVALNTTSLQLIWDSPWNSSDVIIVEYAIELENQTRVVINHDNDTYSYNYTITGLEPGVNYTVVLIVSYNIEIPDTTLAQETTTVTVLETTDTSALATTSSTNSTDTSDLRPRNIQTLDDSIYLFNNTCKSTVRAVYTLIAQTLRNTAPYNYKY